MLRLRNKISIVRLVRGLTRDELHVHNVDERGLGDREGAKVPLEA